MHQISGILDEDDYAHARTKILKDWSTVHSRQLKRGDMLWSMLNQDFVAVLKEPEI